MVVELTLVKAHLVIDHDLDDILLTSYLTTALSIIEGVLGYKEAEFEANEVPESIVIQAKLAICAEFYKNRGLTKDRIFYVNMFNLETLFSPWAEVFIR